MMVADSNVSLNDTFDQHPQQNAAPRKPKFWKISHGKNAGDLKNSAHAWLMEHHFVSQGYQEDSKEGKNQGRYFYEIAEGDYFYLVRESAVVLLGRFASKQVLPVPPDLENIKGWLMREVAVIKDISDRRFMSRQMPGKEIWKPQGFSTVAQVTTQNLPELEQKLLLPAFGVTLKELGIEVEPYAARDTAPAVADASPLNQILYGPPGTGKTYHTVRAALCILENTSDPEGEYDDWKARYEAFADQGRIEFVTFHQSFSYEDFVEGLRADADKGNITYRIKDGIFKQIAMKAMFSRLQSDGTNPDYEAMRERVLQPGVDFSLPGLPHVLIIDEINRGNTSRIFGELITLIESSKRFGRKEALKVRLPYSNEIFRVPDNLYVIGTMNTAGRSLALMDTALRRRFDFIEKMPDLGELSDSWVQGINLARMLAAINDRIEASYDREHTIGHAFFLDLDEDSTTRDLGRIFRNKILPLLEEYFFEDWGKIAQILGKSGIYTRKDFDNLGFEPTGRAYRRNLEALDQEETYLRIYEFGDLAGADE